MLAGIWPRSTHSQYGPSFYERIQGTRLRRPAESSTGGQTGYSGQVSRPAGAGRSSRKATSGRTRGTGRRAGKGEGSARGRKGRQESRGRAAGGGGRGPTCPRAGRSRG